MRTAAALRYVRITGKGTQAFPKLNLNSKRLCRPIPDHLFVSPQVGHDMVRRTSGSTENQASAPVTVLVDSGRGPKSAGEGTSLTIPFKSSTEPSH